MGIFNLLVCLALFVKSQAFAFDLKNKEYRLKNGLKTVLVKYPSPGVASLHIAVRVGSRNEIEKGKTGFAHFFEHLMFRGTKKRNSDDFRDFYNKLGIDNNAWTSDDLTVYHSLVSVGNLGKLLDVESDRFINLSFSEKGLKDEAGAVLGEYNKDIANPDFLLEEKLNEISFKKHPYGHTTMGYRKDVLDFPNRYNDVWPFFKKYYRPENTVLVLVGDIDFQKSEKLIEKFFGPWANPEIEPDVISAEPPLEGPVAAEVSLPTPSQKRIAISYRVPGFSSVKKDTLALNLISEIYLSKISAFQKEYYFDKKYVDGVGTRVPFSIDPALFTVQLRLTSEHTDKEKEMILATEALFDKIQKTTVDEKSLIEAKMRFKKELTGSWFSSCHNLASQMAHLFVLEPDLGVFDRIFARLQEITPQDLRIAAKSYLTKNNQTLVILKGK